VGAHSARAGITVPHDRPQGLALISRIGDETSFVTTEGNVGKRGNEEMTLSNRTQQSCCQADFHKPSFAAALS
jgi:hypothetical protein